MAEVKLEKTVDKRSIILVTTFTIVMILFILNFYLFVYFHLSGRKSDREAEAERSAVC